MSDHTPEASADFAKVNRYRFLLHSTLGVTAAFFCLICLLYLSLFIVIPIVFPFIMVVGPLFVGEDGSGLQSPLLFLMAILAGVPFFYSGMVSGRFLLRAIPPRLSGKRRMGVLIFLAVMTVWYLVTMFSFIFQGTDQPGLAPELALTTFFFTDMILFSKSLAFQVLQYSILVFFWLGGVLPVVRRHWNPRQFLQAPFVLFLRRFSRFPDRTVQHSLLKSAPAGTPVSFLTPTSSRAGDWNPFRVGFSGLKLRKPVRSMPVILRSTNEDWRQAAHELIDHAQTIVMDLSEGSGAIQTEIDMIESAGRWPSVVIFAETGKADAAEAEQIAGYAARGATVIPYRKSWKRALPRLFTGLFVTLLVVLPLFYLVPLVLRMLLHVKAGGGFDEASAPPASMFTFSSWYTFLVNGVIYWLIYKIFFFRPALDKASVQALRKRLRQ